MERQTLRPSPDEILSTTVSEANKRPSAKLTVLMATIERAFALSGETFDAFLRRMYIDDEKSQAEISATLGVSYTAVWKWVHKFIPEEEIRNRSSYGEKNSERQRQLWQDPVHRAIRTANIRAAWHDPSKRDDMLSTHQSLKAKSRRSRGMRKFYRQHPEAYEKLVEQLRKEQKKRKNEKIQESLGDNPKKVLKDLAITKGMSITEIAKSLGRNFDLVRSWLKDYGMAPNHGRINPDYETLIGRRRAIAEAMKNGSAEQLTTAQKQVLISLYLSGERFPTQMSIASFYNCTRANISSLEVRALRTLGLIPQKS